ncbi:hypothetical protein CFB84_30485 [Burkholderia aenigmatica]|uniref:Uncharacterized protein n=1 Tax=Burkholderia aenigmatica TaxID=2015348 RepID=A0A228I501_9BURK|nr:hypothetical protein CFB84_30485 [Burkholderia aenigmatica]
MPDRRNDCVARNVPCAIPSIIPPFCAAPGTPARHCAPRRCSARRDGRRRCVAGARAPCCAATFKHSSPACHECAICTAQKTARPGAGTRRNERMGRRAGTRTAQPALGGSTVCGRTGSSTR